MSCMIGGVTGFLTHHNLQGSQTIITWKINTYKFLTHHNLQGSQTGGRMAASTVGFLPIIIYKVLKPTMPEVILEMVSYPS